jgi:prepilin-type N-terminal cleavage/methylation domain-containing protein
MKKGFGLIEVLISAVVLGFLIVALNRLQLGNREAILRIRTRDAANMIAQHVLDSLGAVGINSLLIGEDGKIINEDIDDPAKGRDYVFGGKDDESTMKFYVKVDYLSSSNPNDLIDGTQHENESTPLTEGNLEPSPQFARNVQATVSWRFRNSVQSIKMSKVLR